VVVNHALMRAAWAGPMPLICTGGTLTLILQWHQGSEAWPRDSPLYVVCYVVRGKKEDFAQDIFH
jgi:hypothetical protein